MNEPLSWKGGVGAAAPLVPGLVSVGVLYGVTATESGMPAWSAVVTSLLVATGTAQFMAVELLGNGTAWWVVVLTGLLVNARFAVYALHLGGFAQAQGVPRRLLYYGLVSDEGYALTVPLVDAGRPARAGRLQWSAGVMLAVWLAWQVGTLVGATAGQVVPAGLNLEMAVPVTLLSVLVLLTSSWRHVVVALVAGAVAVVLRGLPLNLGFVAALGAGVAVGLVLPAVAGPAPVRTEAAS